jgi:hypothetical protein
VGAAAKNRSRPAFFSFFGVFRVNFVWTSHATPHHTTIDAARTLPLISH